MKDSRMGGLWKPVPKSRKTLKPGSIVELYSLQGGSEIPLHEVWKMKSKLDRRPQGC